MKSQKLFKSFAFSFASFLIEKIDLDEINKIILFGSVARGEATKESDIDIFIDTKNIKIKNNLPKIINSFYESFMYKNYWELKNIKNEIKCIVGDLEKWKLKRSIISNGITLYGKTMGEIKGKTFCLFKVNVGGKINEKLKIWRKLYGYKQKTRKKDYYIKGLIEESEKIAPGIFIIPISKSQKIMDFLKKEKLKYQLIEFSTDML